MKTTHTALACLGIGLLVAASTPAVAIESETLAAEEDQDNTSLLEPVRESAEERNMSVPDLEDEMESANTFAILSTEIASDHPDDYAGAEMSSGVLIVRFSDTAPTDAVKSLATLSPTVRIIEHLGWGEAEIAAAGEEAHYAA